MFWQHETKVEVKDFLPIFASFHEALKVVFGISYGDFNDYNMDFVTKNESKN